MNIENKNVIDKKSNTENKNIENKNIKIGTFYGLLTEIGNSEGNIFGYKYISPGSVECLNEIDILSKVNHPYIIHAAGIITKHNFNIDGMAIILPLADRTLFNIITDYNMTTEDKLPILYKLATALEFLHRSKILHLDIKCSNVLIQNIKENIPYFTGFSSTMIVDDIKIGKHNPNTFVTLDHRAPEILNGSRIYNGAVDVWSFGIMMLYVISGRNIYDINFATIKDTDLAETISKLFTSSNHLENLLINVRPKYRSLCIDLFTKILKINPNDRITATEICNHELFDEFKNEENREIGYIANPDMSHDYSEDHRAILKLLIHWSRELYSESNAELLFLAIDIFNRGGSFYKNRETNDRMAFAATCLWISAKLTRDKIIPLQDFINEITKMVPLITPNDILENEIEIIHIFNGILNVSHLYQSCIDKEELHLSLRSIILDKDSTLYSKTNVSEWILMMKTIIPNQESIVKNKQITISELV